MIMLYGGENKNLKTILIMAALLAFLGKPKRRLRGRRGRRYRNSRRPLQGSEDVDKTQAILSAVQSVMNYMNVSAQARKAQQDSEGGLNASGADNGSMGKESEDSSQQASREGQNVEVNKQTSSPGGHNEAEFRSNPSSEGNLPVTNRAGGRSNRTAESFTAEGDGRRNNRQNQRVCRADNQPMEMRRKDITELIKEIFHGVNITVDLSNGKTAEGEVIGTYQGILILRKAGVINYIRGEAIVSFS